MRNAILVWVLVVGTVCHVRGDDDDDGGGTWGSQWTGFGFGGSSEESQGGWQQYPFVPYYGTGQTGFSRYFQGGNYPWKQSSFYPFYNKRQSDGDSSEEVGGGGYPFPGGDSDSSEEVDGGGIGYPVNGGWSHWSHVSTECSATCGGGSRVITRTRRCNNPFPANGGAYCKGSNKAELTVPCHTDACQVDGGWSSWSLTVGDCSASCGGGSKTITRTRTCTNPAPAFNGRYCIGDSKSTYTQACNAHSCPVDGAWSLWAETLGDCSASCGGGSQLVTRTRTCTNPAPAHNGKYCFGDDKSSYTQACNTNGCPVDGGWTAWTITTGDCSASCGGGSKVVTKTRTCTNPTPTYNGKYCFGDDKSTYTEACNTQGCSVDGGWSAWTITIGDCSAPCGGGSKVVTRTRTCTNPAPAYNGKYCFGDDKDTFTKACNVQGCPVDGGWSAWTITIGNCSASCGGGSKVVTRTRTCTNPAPAYHGKYCVGGGKDTKIKACNSQGCPVDGGWSPWVDTANKCSVSCGGGLQLVTRKRTCTNPKPSYNGQYCVGDDKTTYSEACNKNECPVDGGWSVWSETVGDCSASCGGGSQLITRTRTCTNPTPAYYGQYCVGDDKESYTQTCNIKNCPVDGSWSAWAETVGDCSASCGGGSRLITRTRTCTNPTPAFYGQYCFGDDKETSTEICNSQSCPVDGGWSAWTETVGDCSASCGGGSRLITKTRTCTNPVPANYGQYCFGKDKETYTQTCNTKTCPVDGGWSAWTQTFGDCSASCGGGSRLVTRTRTCTNPKPAYYGQSCLGNDKENYTESCNTKSCPVDGGWSVWTETVSKCSAYCGGGSQTVTRTRTCTNPAPSYNGKYCVGDDKTFYTQACNTQGCPVDGSWSLWTETVGKCSAACGGGSQTVTRTRTCTNPTPAYHGKYCVGDDKTFYTKACKTHGCPVDGGWSLWTETVGKCSAACGGGSQTVTRTRTCTNPTPAYNGKYCVGDDKTFYTQACNTHGCSVDGGWSLWTETVGKCSAACGGGSQTVTRTRTCTNPAPAYNGQNCVGDDKTSYTQACNTNNCPVDGGWSLWTETVGKCSVACGGGSQTVTRKRTCTNPAPAYNGQYCVGDDKTSYTQACNTQSCSVDGGWSAWTDTVGKCSATCGGGSQTVTRTRTCTNPTPAHYGQYCVGKDKTTYTQACNIQGCGVDGGWSVWTETLGKCSVSCGGGSQLVTRTRTCTNPVPAYGGKYCVGDARITFSQICGKRRCPVDGGWSDWTFTAESCSATCGGGSRTIIKTRSCTNPPPGHGGRQCAGNAREVLTETCNAQDCPVTKKPDLGLCTDCKIVNGVGYNRYPTDCNKYVQCNFDNNRLIEYHIKACPHGLYWDQDKLTCNYPGLVLDCPYERCKDPSMTSYPSTSGCRAYWHCEGGVSRGKCCPKGQAYSISGYCIPSTTCTDTCEDDDKEDKCDKRPLIGDKSKFQQYVKGYGWKIMFCATGTSYNATDCRCSIIDGGIPMPDGCKAEVYLSFADVIADKSGSGIFVQNDGVIIKNGAAYFDGKSGLRIPRFSNVGLGGSLYIKLRYKGEGSATRKQALLSNGDCGKESSISIARGPASTHFSVLSQAGQRASVFVPSLANGWNEAVFKLDKGILSGQVSSHVKQALFQGEIQRGQCAMQIGRGTDFANFRGYIDNMTIYLCKPSP